MIRDVSERQREKEHQAQFIQWFTQSVLPSVEDEQVRESFQAIALHETSHGEIESAAANKEQLFFQLQLVTANWLLKCGSDVDAVSRIRQLYAQIKEHLLGPSELEAK